MENKSGRKNVAFCIGDLEGGKMLLQGFCKVLGDNLINVHIFNCCTCFYDGAPHNIGQTNIFTLPNYDIIDMLVIAPFYLSSSEEVIQHTIERAVEKNIPVLTIGKQYDYPNCYCIMPDYRRQIEMITNHLIERHGIRKLNFLGGFKNHFTSDERLAGFLDALKSHNIPIEPSRIYYGNLWSVPTIQQVEKMNEDGNLDCGAIVCANDTMASAVMIKLSELGFDMPGEIAVTGMDGTDEANGYITTAKILADKSGEEAANIVANLLLRDKKPAKLGIIPPNIIYGISCRCTNTQNALDILPKQRHDLFEELYDARRFSIRTAAIAQELANCSTFDDASRSISATLSRIWCNNSWICICKDFMESSLVNDSIDDIEDNCPVHIHGYCDTMKCIARYADRKPQSETEFPTSEMLPDFYEMSDKSKVILYTPIHIRDNTLGYLAFNFYPWSSMNYLLNYLTMAMSQLLESVRRQNELYAYAKKIDMLYITDPLTTLYNRRGFFRIYNDYAEGGVKDDCMVISVDLDNLKLINDNFGHNEGDNAILTMANALKSAADENDICARFGGDEYVVFGKGKGEYEMNAYIDKVNEYLSEYNLTSEKPYNVHGSFGGCIVPKGSKLHIDYYINKADSKMYVEKESHKRTRMLHDYSKDKPQTDE